MPEGKLVDYVFLKDVPSRLYGEMLVEALRKQDIPAIIKSDDIGIVLGSYGTTSPVRVEVWVDRASLEEAKDLANIVLDGI